ncbi:MAG: N-acetylmuramoyl-L-alanine amidase [Saprospiraceae bacterium]|nr:N-acetylmuramoyl-L-alanine amidase [Saprospiraceae bacterium]
MKDMCVFLDPGHGALDKNGNYVTAPAKQFQHTQGTFHNGRWFYEGVFNRVMTNRVAMKLQRLNIPYLIVAHEYLDTPLEYRVNMANWYHRNFKPGIYISFHANAANGQARGYEVYTSPGKTDSDSVAELHWNNVKDLLSSKISMRPDTADGDVDKEANFYVLRNTAMPAILIEHLFFDNFEDAKLLLDDEVVDLFAEATTRTIVQWFK